VNNDVHWGEACIVSLEHPPSSKQESRCHQANARVIVLRIDLLSNKLSAQIQERTLAEFHRTSNGASGNTDG